MEKSVPEQRSSPPQELKFHLGSLLALGRILKWLASFMPLTEAEQEEARIHIERMDGE